jgi:hypothetical protein
MQLQSSSKPKLWKKNCKRRKNANIMDFEAAAIDQHFLIRKCCFQRCTTRSPMVVSTCSKAPVESSIEQAAWQSTEIGAKDFCVDRQV